MTASSVKAGSCKSAAGGSCAFCGAKMALQPIVDAAHLVHGVSSCQGLTWEMRPTGTSSSVLHRLLFSTGLGECDIVHGSGARLAKALEAVACGWNPAAVFVYQTCIPAITGTDTAAVCRDAARRTGRPVVLVDGPGFIGGRQEGAEAAGRTLMDHVIGSMEPAERTPTDIVLIGDYNVAGETWQVRPLLEELGIRVLASIPGDARYAEVAAAHRARVVVSLCSRALGGLAAEMHARYGIPVLEGSFYGAANVSATLSALARLLAALGGPAGLPARAQAVIAREEARIAPAVQSYRARLAGKRAVLVTGGIKAWSLAAAVKHLGMDVVGTSVHKTSAGERRRAAGAVGEERLLDGWPEPSWLETERVDVVLSGGPNRRKLAKRGIAWVEINHERGMALSGYDGTVRLAAALDAAINAAAAHRLYARFDTALCTDSV